MLVQSKSIKPLHPITDMKKCKKIRKNMRKRGWGDNLPILAAFLNEQLFAVTGTHRLHAAYMENVQVEVYVIDPRKFDAYRSKSFTSLNDLLLESQENRLEILKAIGDQTSIEIYQKERI